MTREYKKWKNRSTNKNEQLLKIQHYIKVRLLHDRHNAARSREQSPYCDFRNYRQQVQLIKNTLKIHFKMDEFSKI